MKEVFVDTGGFCALLLAEDDFHVRAAALVREAQEGGWRLKTTNMVVAETHALLLVLARTGRAAGLAFLDLIDAGLAEVVRITESDEQAAIAIVRAHEDKVYSMCDAISFVVMERLGIADAIAFDRHFRSYGKFNVLE